MLHHQLLARRDVPKGVHGGVFGVGPPRSSTLAQLQSQGSQYRFVELTGLSGGAWPIGTHSIRAPAGNERLAQTP